MSGLPAAGRPRKGAHVERPIQFFERRSRTSERQMEMAQRSQNPVRKQSEAIKVIEQVPIDYLRRMLYLELALGEITGVADAPVLAASRKKPIPGQLRARKVRR